jgi:hypothetical protein
MPRAASESLPVAGCSGFLCGTATVALAASESRAGPGAELAVPPGPASATGIGACNGPGEQGRLLNANRQSDVRVPRPGGTSLRVRPALDLRPPRLLCCATVTVVLSNDPISEVCTCRHGGDSAGAGCKIVPNEARAFSLKFRVLPVPST